MDNVILLWDLTKQVPPNKLLGHKVKFIRNRIKFMIWNSVQMVLS